MDDKELLLLLDTSPQDGIRKLADLYGSLVWSVAYGKLSGRFGREDIEECVSDIFLDIYQYRNKIDLDKGSIKTILMIITRRKIIKYYQRKSSDAEYIQWEESENLLPSSGNTLEQEIIRKEQNHMVFEAIKALGEPDSTIIVQKYYYSMTAKEIGKGLGLTKNAVEKRAKRALEKLRRDCYGIIQ